VLVDTLIQLDARALYDFGPFDEVALHLRGKFLGRVADRFSALTSQPLARIALAG
jgi:hypothetical protein